MPTENNGKPYEIRVSGSRNFRVYVSDLEGFLQNYDDFLDELGQAALTGYRWWWDLPLIESLPILKKGFDSLKSRFTTPKNIIFYTKSPVRKNQREKLTTGLDTFLSSEIGERKSKEYNYKMWRDILIYGVTFSCYIATGIVERDQGLWNALLSTPALVGDVAIILSYPVSALESIQESKRSILEAVKDSGKQFELYERE